MIHLKTSGTSYLESLRIIARYDPQLFREIIDYSIKRFEEDRKTYHLSTDLSKILPPSEVADHELEKAYLDDENGRQVLHVTYGSILTARREDGGWLFRNRIKRVLIDNEEEYYRVIAEHIERHIKPLWFTR